MFLGTQARKGSLFKSYLVICFQEGKRDRFDWMTLFFNIMYSGVIDLQDEIFLKNKLGELDVVGVSIKSNDDAII